MGHLVVYLDSVGDLSERVLVVEDDASMLQTLALALARFGEVERASSVAEAVASLQRSRPSLVVLDFALQDGDARHVLAALEGDGWPAVVAISGTATPVEAFELASLGVGAWLEKPFSLEALIGAVERARSQAPRLAPFVRRCVGLRGLDDVEDEVRRVMTDEALGRAQGSRRRAARLLEVSRQVVQHMLKRRR